MANILVEAEHIACTVTYSFALLNFTTKCNILTEAVQKVKTMRYLLIRTDTVFGPTEILDKVFLYRTIELKIC